MPLFYLRGGRARRQVGGGWLVVCCMGILLSAFRRDVLKRKPKICSVAIEIKERSVYNDSEHLCRCASCSFLNHLAIYLMQIFTKSRGI